MRLRTDIWIAGYLRRVMAGGAYVVVRRKGAPEAGAIFIRIDRLDGSSVLFGPAPQAALDDDNSDRRFVRMHDAEFIDGAAVEARLAKEMRFDPDLWIVEVEDRAGRTFLDDYLV
jgi:hypothetical protein